MIGRQTKFVPIIDAFNLRDDVHLSLWTFLKKRIRKVKTKLRNIDWYDWFVTAYTNRYIVKNSHSLQKALECLIDQQKQSTVEVDDEQEGF